MASPVSDPLSDRLSLASLHIGAVAAGVTTSAELVMGGAGPMPLSQAAILKGTSGAASHTLDVKIQGRQLSTDAWTDLITFTQLTNGNFSTAQRVNLPLHFSRFQIIWTAIGAFGSSQVLGAACVFAGTDLYHAPYTPV